MGRRDTPLAELRASDREVDADILQLRRSVPTLEAVERRRAQLWAIAGLLILASGTSVLLLLVFPGAAELLPSGPGLRVGFLAIGIAFLAYVFDQERRLRRLSAALVAERVLSQALESRVRDLATLSRVGQVVNSVLSMTEVLEVVLDGAFHLTRAGTGAVMLRDGDDLVVAVSAGDRPAPPDSRQPMGTGVAGWVAAHREPVLINGSLNEGQFTQLRERSRGDASSVVAPMLLADELLGVLTLERPAGSPPFTDWELRAVSLFASHAATAVANARRYDEQRDLVEQLSGLLDRRAEHVARMVHDLKTPLTAVIGFLSLLRRRPTRIPEEQTGELLARSETAAYGMLELVERILDAASVEALTDAAREPLELGAFVTELARTTEDYAATRDGVPRQVNVDRAPGDLLVWTHVPAVRSIVTNLLENAVKYSPAGAAVDVRVELIDGRFSIAVTDRGPGVPEADRERIFDRFTQREPSAGGAGLGLHIVRSLAERLGGTVELRTGPSGSTFEVRLPSAPGSSVVEQPSGTSASIR